MTDIWRQSISEWYSKYEQCPTCGAPTASPCTDTRPGQEGRVLGVKHATRRRKR